MKENDATRCMNSEAHDAANLNEDKSIDMEHEVNVVGKSSRILSFHERVKGLSPYRRSLKDRMRDKQFPTLICFNRVHLHQEGTTKKSPKHLGGWEHRNRVDSNAGTNFVCSQTLISYP